MTAATLERRLSRERIVELSASEWEGVAARIVYNQPPRPFDQAAPDAPPGVR